MKGKKGYKMINTKKIEKLKLIRNIEIQSKILRNILESYINKNIDQTKFNILKENYFSIGFEYEFIDLIIYYFSKSASFKIADYRYNNNIKPLLQYFNKRHAINIIDAIEENPQLYNRSCSFSSNTEIIKKCKHLLESDFDFGQYYNFIFDKTVISYVEKRI